MRFQFTLNIAAVLAIFALHRTDGCLFNWHDWITIPTTPTPTAVPVTPATVCPAPPLVGNAVHYTAQPSYNPGEVVTYKCVNQTYLGQFFQLVGDPSNECQDDGSWSKMYGDGELPECVRVEDTCPHNQEYAVCGSACRLKCGQEEHVLIDCIDHCVEGCACPSSVPYLTSSGVCVAEEDCPSDESTSVTLPPTTLSTTPPTTTTTPPPTTPTTTPTTTTTTPPPTTPTTPPTTTIPTTTPEADTWCIIHAPCEPGFQCVDVDGGSDYLCCREDQPTSCTGGRFTTTTLPVTTTAATTTTAPNLRLCGSPPAVINDAVLTVPPDPAGDVYEPGSSVSYACTEGYVDVGGNLLECNDGSWTVPVGGDEPSCLPVDVDSDVVIVLDNDRNVDNCEAKEAMLGSAPYDASQAQFSTNFPNFYRQLVVSKMLASNWRSNSSRWALKYPVGDCNAEDFSDYGFLRTFDEPLEQLMNDGQYSCVENLFHLSGIRCSDKYLDSNEETNRKMIIIFSQNTDTIVYTTGIWSIYLSDDEAAEIADVFVISTLEKDNRDYQRNINFWNELVCDKANSDGSCLFNGAFIGSQWDDVDQLNNEIRNFYTPPQQE